jgi:hypothetical protein
MCYGSAGLDRRNVTIRAKLAESFPKAKASDKIICCVRGETFTPPISRHVKVKIIVYKLYIYSPIRLQGIVLNQLSTGTALPFYLYRKSILSAVPDAGP